MGLRDNLKGKVKGLVNKLSGEHSAVAPETPTATYSRTEPDEEREVIMARLNRPKKKR